VNKENASKLWKIIQEAGDYLRGQGINWLRPVPAEQKEILT
jgi:hypothetical protein